MRLGAETPGRSALIGKVRYAARKDFLKREEILMNEKTTFRQKVMQAKGKKGFTLVELVIVIAVLAIIAFIAIPTVSHVIENANVSADASNAQAVETAIKTAQSEIAANNTTLSDKANALITPAKDKTQTLGYLLETYGISAENIGLVDGTNDKLKVSGHHFYCDPSTYKVVAADAAPNGYEVLKSGTAYVIKDNALTLTLS